MESNDLWTIYRALEIARDYERMLATAADEKNRSYHAKKADEYGRIRREWRAEIHTPEALED